MFAKLFALFFDRKKKPESTLTFREQREAELQKRFAQPVRTGKSNRSSVTYSRSQSEDIMSNPVHPLNPLNPLNPIGFNNWIYHDSTPSHTPHSSSSYDCGSSSSSSYDSGSSSSCDSGSSSSSGGD